MVAAREAGGTGLVSHRQPRAIIASVSRITFISLILLLFAAPLYAQSYTVAPNAKFTAFDSNGNPVSGAKLCTYQSGTTTPATTYSSSAGVANVNPVLADSAGRMDVWLVAGQTYRFTLLNPGTTTDCTTGSTIWSVDGIGAVPSTSSNLDVLGTAGEAISAGQVVYLSDGSNSKTAGQWFKSSANFDYATSRAITGIAPNAIASAAAGSIRLGGQATGLSALTVGATYYVSNTAGSLTATAPTNARAVGVADTTSSLILIGAQPVQGAPIPLGLDEFRLSLTTSSCITTADVTGASAVTIFLTPCGGNRITLFDASGNPTVYTSPEISVAVPGTTNQMYDVFAFASTAGAPSLEVLAWTSDTARATGLVRNVASGVWTKSADATRRYLGSFRTTAVSGQTEDSLAKRYLWNNYNRVPRQLQVTEATASWTYTIATLRQARTTSSNQLDYVVGIQEAPIEAQVVEQVSNDNAGVIVTVNIGVDSTSVGSALSSPNITPAANYRIPVAAVYRGFPGIGRHTLVWLEYSGAGVGTTTWYGTTAGTSQLAGITGTVIG